MQDAVASYILGRFGVRALNRLRPSIQALPFALYGHGIRDLGRTTFGGSNDNGSMHSTSGRTSFSER